MREVGIRQSIDIINFDLTRSLAADCAIFVQFSNTVNVTMVTDKKPMYEYRYQDIGVEESFSYVVSG
jgi:hypothetical protein